MTNLYCCGVQIVYACDMRIGYRIWSVGSHDKKKPENSTKPHVRGVVKIATDDRAILQL